MQFNNQSTSSLFKKTMKALPESKQATFARTVKKIADKKIVSDSADFTITVDDLKIALATI